MKSLLRFAAIVLFFLPAIAAIANDEILKNALNEYDKVVQDYKKMKGENEKADEGKKLSREQYNELKKGIDKAIDLLDQYVRVGTDETAKKACRHYALTMEQYDFTIKNDLREFRDNFNAISRLDDKLRVLQGYYYPLRYSAGGKNYIIDADKRSNLEKNLLVEFTETCTNYGKSAETIQYAKRAYTHYKYGDYNLWWTSHLWYFHANKLYYTGNEMLEPSEKVIYAMSGMKRSDIKKIKDSNWVNYTHAYTKINSLLSINPSLSRTGEVWAKAGEAFEKLEEDKWATECYTKALKDGYGDRTFLVNMMNKGKDKKDKELVKTAAGIFDSKNLYYTYTCSDYDMMAGYFEFAGDGGKAAELKEKYKTCKNDEEKRIRKEGRKTKFLLSFAPLPLLSGNLQGSIQLGMRNKLHEFGVRQVNEQKDVGLDMFGKDKKPENMIWSGMAYYYTYKRFLSGGDRNMYFGFQLRYTDKIYEPQAGVNISNANNNTFVRNATLNPTEKRYDITFQSGFLGMTRFFHFEYYSGFGVGFSIFDGGADEWNNGGYKITNHTFLSERKETRIGLTLRLGIKVGLNLINRGAR